MLTRHDERRHLCHHSPVFCHLQPQQVGQLHLIKADENFFLSIFTHHNYRHTHLSGFFHHFLRLFLIHGYINVRVSNAFFLQKIFCQCAITARRRRINCYFHIVCDAHSAACRTTYVVGTCDLPYLPLQCITKSYSRTAARTPIPTFDKHENIPHNVKRCLGSSIG